MQITDFGDFSGLRPDPTPEQWADETTRVRGLLVAAGAHDLVAMVLGVTR